MQKLYTAYYCVFFFFLSSSLYAQRTITIAGDSCLGDQLTAEVRNAIPKIISWYNDSILVHVQGRWNADATIVAGGNGEGQAPNQFYSPRGIFVDKSFNLYVVDNTRIQRWAKNATSGVTVAGGNGKGTALNQFYSPNSVWVDENQNVYVSDALANRVMKWAKGATTGVIVAGGNGGGSGINQLFSPGAISMDKSGYLYIADRWNDRVMKWFPGAASGTIVAGGNGRGGADNQLYEPGSIALDTAGNLYVSDVYNDRVVRWDIGAATGVKVAGGNGAGNNANQFNNPGALYIDSIGNIYVSDNANYRIQRWEPGSDFGITIAGGTGYGTASNQLSSMSGMCIDKKGRVYVSEIIEERVKLFSTASVADSVYVPLITGNYKAVATFKSGSKIQSKIHKVITKPDKPQLKGPGTVIRGKANLTYQVTNIYPGAYYNWSVPADAVITSGQGTPVIKVTWGFTDGSVSVYGYNACGISPTRSKYIYSSNAAKPVLEVSNPTFNQTKLFPNPAVNEVSIVFKSVETGKYIVQLTDVTGRVFMQQAGASKPGENKINLNIGRFSKGIYYVNFINAQHQKQVLKLEKL